MFMTVTSIQHDDRDTSGNPKHLVTCCSTNVLCVWFLSDTHWGWGFFSSMIHSHLTKNMMHIHIQEVETPTVKAWRRVWKNFTGLSAVYRRAKVCLFFTPQGYRCSSCPWERCSCSGSPDLPWTPDSRWTWSPGLAPPAGRKWNYCNCIVLKGQCTNLT